MSMFETSLLRQEMEANEVQGCLQDLFVLLVKLELYPSPSAVHLALSDYRDKYCETVKTPRFSGARDNGRKQCGGASELAFQNAIHRDISDDSKAYCSLSKEVSKK